jgi:hypothetical protein
MDAKIALKEKIIRVNSRDSGAGPRVPAYPPDEWP